MSNGDAELLPEPVAPGQNEAPPTPARKARAVKTATTKRTAKAAVSKTPGSATPKSTAARRPFAKSVTATRSKGFAGGRVRVRLGNSEMFVSQALADALTDKDRKRVRAVFRRALKRARKGQPKKKR